MLCRSVGSRRGHPGDAIGALGKYVSLSPLLTGMPRMFSLGAALIRSLSLSLSLSPSLFDRESLNHETRMR